MSSAVVAIHQSELETRALKVSERAKTIVVHDQATYEEAARFLLDVIAPMIGEVHEAYDSIVKKNYDAWQEACAPLEHIKSALGAKIAAYEREQRVKQQEAERLAWEAAERAAAEMAESSIERAEAHGATADEVRAMVEQPAALPKPAVAPAIQRVEGIVRRSAYKAEVVNLRELARDVAEGNCPEAYLRPNETALNAAARSLGPELMRFVRGVRVVEVNTVAARKR
jgi:ATPase subunit of ABC transporter with duplicated ATPase domains